MLRRSKPIGSSIAVGDLVINDDISLVQRAGVTVGLTETERRLLGFLAQHRDRLVSKTQILTAVWGYKGSTRTWSRCTSHPAEKVGGGGHLSPGPRRPRPATITPNAPTRVDGAALTSAGDTSLVSSARATRRRVLLIAS